MSNKKNIYEFNVKNASGTMISLNDYKNKVLLIVNTASACGYTPQYEGLEILNKKYLKLGLSILAFPCNQFGAQEKASDTDIQQFCSLKYDVTFPVMAKINVNGTDADPFFNFLKARAPGLLGTEMIKWNFTKFLVSKKGNVIKRYAPATTPTEIEEDIKSEL